MQQNPQSKKPRSPLARIIALIAALIVIIGTIFVVFQPKKGNDTSLIPTARAASGTEKPWKDLKKGASGSDVKQIQTALHDLGFYNGAIDGNFSRAFEEAVLAFQQDWGLDANGVIDEDTFELLTQGLPEASPTPVCNTRGPSVSAKPSPTPTAVPFVVKGQSYTDKEHVAAYIRQFRELPPNYITKNEASALGWVSSWGNLDRVAPGKSIGGDRYGNYEGKLPYKSGRRYYECDIDFDGTYRNDKRIVYSSDGLIFYTGDHYNTFEEIK